MNDSLNRRRFLQQTSVLTAGFAAYSTATLRAQNAANKKLLVGVMGLGRGRAHLAGFMAVPNVEIAYVCDIDDKRLAEGVRIVTGKQSRAPKAVKDFRQILDDPEIDILSIAAPNFWHAPATILACKAGKHVYVEKPGSHNAREGELMVEAARKYNRYVQMGNQRRSYPAMIEAVQKLRDGVIGKLKFARCWYNGARPSIGKGKPAPVPEGIDYNLWQGPTPERPFKDNVLHYNWHWLWHYGGGELANNGIHALDIARWCLGAEYPTKVTFLGGRYHFDDDQETPDTGVAIYDFGDMGATWDNSSCHPRASDKHNFVSIYGEGGTMALTGNGYTVFDLKGKELQQNPGKGGDVPHFTNLVDCIRYGGRLNSDISEGQKSTLLCHLGNIAYRTGHVLNIDPKTGKIIGDKDAQKLWGREYRKGWEPKV
ncbi:MAG: Gfo/Idh/MocA family oxidoreductase [Verrucomicrobiota bacterium]